MLSYCLKCRKTASKNMMVTNTNKGKLFFLSTFTVYDSNKSRFIKKEGASKLLSNLGLKIDLSKVSFLGDILF